MNLYPHRCRMRRTRWLAPAAFLMMAWGSGIGAARADIYVHVMNCTEAALEAQAFDAKDSVKAVGASEAKFSTYNPGETQKLHCAGEGKGYCQMVVLAENVPPSGCGDITQGGHVDFHLDSDKWAVVTGFKQSDDGKTCTPVVEENLDAAPSSCS